MQIFILWHMGMQQRPFVAESKSMWTIIMSEHNRNSDMYAIFNLHRICLIMVLRYIKIYLRTVPAYFIKIIKSLVKDNIYKQNNFSLSFIA